MREDWKWSYKALLVGWLIVAVGFVIWWVVQPSARRTEIPSAIVAAAILTVILLLYKWFVVRK